MIANNKATCQTISEKIAQIDAELYQMRAFNEMMREEYEKEQAGKN